MKEHPPPTQGEPLSLTDRIVAASKVSFQFGHEVATDLWADARRRMVQAGKAGDHGERDRCWREVREIRQAIRSCTRPAAPTRTREGSRALMQATRTRTGLLRVRTTGRPAGPRPAARRPQAASSTAASGDDSSAGEPEPPAPRRPPSSSAPPGSPASRPRHISYALDAWIADIGAGVGR